jgi:hypothetical protein
MQSVMREMIRPCSKCQRGNMHGETQTIPRQINVSFPVVGSVPIPTDNYLPDSMRRYRNYTVFVCEFCGNLEFALS